MQCHRLLQEEKMDKGCFYNHMDVSKNAPTDSLLINKTIYIILYDNNKALSNMNAIFDLNPPQISLCVQIEDDKPF